MAIISKYNFLVEQLNSKNDKSEVGLFPQVEKLPKLTLKFS